jgi:thymidylate kinase
MRDLTPDLFIFLDIKMDKYMEELNKRLPNRFNEKANHFDKKDLGFYQRAYNGYQYLEQKYKDR